MGREKQEDKRLSTYTHSLVRVEIGTQRFCPRTKIKHKLRGTAAAGKYI